MPQFIIHRDNITGVRRTILLHHLIVAGIILLALFMIRDAIRNDQWRFLADYSFFVFFVYMLLDVRKEYYEAKVASMCDKYRDAAGLYS